jgi:hypothetical protein
MVKQGICGRQHAYPTSQELRLLELLGRQSSSRSAFIPTLTEEVERGTSRLSVKFSSLVDSLEELKLINLKWQTIDRSPY